MKLRSVLIKKRCPDSLYDQPLSDQFPKVISGGYEQLTAISFRKDQLKFNDHVPRIN